MDEPTSALDPATAPTGGRAGAGPDKDYTIIIVTHNMHQALPRVSDYTPPSFTRANWSNLGTRRPSSAPTTGTSDYVNGRFG
ncbi:MAG: hypothetical protein R2857_15475 [Vampirovibrionales bacterium]